MMMNNSYCSNVVAFIIEINFVMDYADDAQAKYNNPEDALMRIWYDALRTHYVSGHLNKDSLREPVVCNMNTPGANVDYTLIGAKVFVILADCAAPPTGQPNVEHNKRATNTTKTQLFK